MEKIHQLKRILKKSLRTEGTERVRNINLFLKEVWEDESINNEYINDILTNIAYDLEFYEPSNGDWRIDTPIYYDGVKMDEILEKAIKDIDTLLANLKNVIDVTVSKK